MKINTLSDYLKQHFGTKVYKLSLSTGCSCPNRDGTISFGGCTFCSEGGSGDFATKPAPILQQIEEAKKRVDAKFPKKINASDRKYIAYFQSYTNTYGNEEELKMLFKQAASVPEVCAVSIGTRPDCLSDSMISFLSELNNSTEVWVELGLQTIHEETAKRVNRGYSLAVFDDTYARLKAAGITVIVHVILGLPGETEEMMLETVRYVSELNPVLDGIKLQLLHVLEGTVLARQFKEAPFHIYALEEYIPLLIKCLKLLPEETVVHRLTGDGPKRLLIAPLWTGDKKKVLNEIKKCIENA